MRNGETENNLTEEMRAWRKVKEDRQTFTQILLIKEKGRQLKRIKEVMGVRITQ